MISNPISSNLVFLEQQLQEGFGGRFFRSPLVLLQALLAAVMSSHLQFGANTSSLQDLVNVSVIGLGLLSLALSRMPTAMLNKPWFATGLTFVDLFLVTAITLGTHVHHPAFVLPYVLILLIAACSPTLVQIVGLSIVLCGSYGVTLYRQGALTQDHLLAIPVLLIMAVLYGRYTDQIRRINEAEEKLQHESLYDSLTRLPNRELFLKRVWRSIASAKKHDGYLFAILFIDLDGFKPINDGLGHKAGDAVLVKVAERLQMSLRHGDVVSRFGGDEFTLLLDHITSRTEAIRVAERILAKLNAPFKVGRSTVQIGASIGIAFSTNIYQRPEDLVRDADVAMYRAKASGKNRYEISNQIRDMEVTSSVMA
jgi:diguanylate cyclase (GGDEF)-like protein